MGKFDKDRYQKELAIKYCLARGLAPFLEVVVPSSADLSDDIEVLTDIDVLGVEMADESGLRRTIFDCKTGKMSSINRAFWAAGVMRFTLCDNAFIILKSRAVNNHRLTALSLSVDLHDEFSFSDLGKTIDPAFPNIKAYQSEIENWNVLYEIYERNGWAKPLYELVHDAAPLSRAPWNVFRRVVTELARGQFDPAKDGHLAIFFDVLASTFVLWATMGRDIRRFYDPSMGRPAFEKILKYYIWGGREAFVIRQQIRDLMMKERAPGERVEIAELPAWDSLLSFSGHILSAPQYLIECAIVCREYAIRCSVGIKADEDKELFRRLRSNSRVRQFSLALGQYLVASSNLPKDFERRVNGLLLATE